VTQINSVHSRYILELLFDDLSPLLYQLAEPGEILSQLWQAALTNNDQHEPGLPSKSPQCVTEKAKLSLRVERLIKILAEVEIMARQNGGM
jgi:hypothetical protein